MAYEVACFCPCHTVPARGIVPGWTEKWHGVLISVTLEVCRPCFGTGRVTLGIIVAAERARRVKEAT